MVLAVVLLLLVGWTSADSIACPDGCTDALVQTVAMSPHSGVGCCALCHGGFTSGGCQPSVERVAQLRRPIAVLALAASPLLVLTIDHPPRA